MLSDEAKAKVIQIGAIEATVVTIPEITPLAYLPGLASRMKIKAIGDLDVTKINQEVDDDINFKENLSNFKVDERPFEEKIRPKYDDYDFGQ